MSNPMHRVLCYLGFHKWDWYVPNYEHTIIGTQWCTRCQKVIQGVKIK